VWTQYSTTPPTPQSALFNAENFTINVCGLTSSYVHLPYVYPNEVRISATDPTNTFFVSVVVYVQ
jgi:hypothetical protein